jgi:hypothetical protein
MERQAAHPELYTPAQALAYLNRPCGDDANPTPEELSVLESLKDRHGLRAIKGIGRGCMYHRTHLDALVMRLAGIAAPHPEEQTGPAPLRMTKRS